jgi:hypothetical protein
LQFWTGAFVDRAIAVVVEAVADLGPGKRLDIRYATKRPILTLQDALGAYPCEPCRARCTYAGNAFIDQAITVIIFPVALFG